MIEINLIPDVKQELLKAQRTRAAVISTSILASIIGVAVVVVLLVYVFGVQTLRNVVADNTIKEQYEKFSQVEDLTEMLTMQNQLSKISELNNSKTITSRFFDMLSAVIPPEPNSVQISNTNIDTEVGTISLEGQTRAYDSMEVFKKTLTSAVIEYSKDGQTVQVPLASNISTTDVSYGASADGTKVLRFDISFKYAEELFSPQITAQTIKLSIDGNVTDSYLGIPKSIFTERAKDL
jgi:Fimbrial assembly protein (PilN).